MGEPLQGREHPVAQVREKAERDFVVGVLFGVPQDSPKDSAQEDQDGQIAGIHSLGDANGRDRREGGDGDRAQVSRAAEETGEQQDREKGPRENEQPPDQHIDAAPHTITSLRNCSSSCCSRHSREYRTPFASSSSWLPLSAAAPSCMT